METSRRVFRAIGLMSGTSIDGIDAALLETDGRDVVRPMGFVTLPYDDAFRERLRACFGRKNPTTDPAVPAVEHELTERHAKAVRALLDCLNLKPENIDLIGFHGQTLWHEPTARLTVQIGDGPLLARLTGIAVINDFRSADVRAGGQGAPLVPLYHRALAANLPKPVGIINIGGISNITWLGENDDEILAFDMGPGNAQIDDWMLRHTGKSYDKDGSLAATGAVNEQAVKDFLAHPFFQLRPPKSLERSAFSNVSIEKLNPADGTATLTMMTAKAIAEGLRFLPQPPVKLIISGGGRHNATMAQWIAEATGVPIEPIDCLGWNGDALEAEAFAYLAVRSSLGLPISLPGTTGAPKPMTGGTLFSA